MSSSEEKKNIEPNNDGSEEENNINNIDEYMMLLALQNRIDRARQARLLEESILLAGELAQFINMGRGLGPGGRPIGPPPPGPDPGPGIAVFDVALDPLMGLFGLGLAGGNRVRNRAANILEERMLEAAIRESEQMYKTMERKPHVKLSIGKMLFESLEEQDRKTCLTCSICRDDFIPKDEIMLLECKHIFHDKCISEWGKYKAECPSCRKPIKTVSEDAKEQDADGKEEKEEQEEQES